MIYKFREGYGLPVKAQVIGERIAELEERLGSTVGTHDVVRDAESEDSPLHPCFEWDDDKAAHNWRLAQAGRILRSIEVVRVGKNGVETTEIAYVSRNHGQVQSAYMNTRSALSDSELAEVVIAEAKSILAGFTRRYRHLVTIAKEFAPVVTAIDAMQEKEKANGEAKASKRPEQANRQRGGKQAPARPGRQAVNRPG